MLTELSCRKAKPRELAYKLADSDGLYLQVAPNGSKYWRLKYRVDRKEKRLAFGVYPEISLSEARERREEARRLIRGGKDPALVKQEEKRERQARAANRFDVLAEDWFTLRSPGWAPTTMRKVRFYLDKDLIPALGSRPVTEIRRTELVDFLQLMEQREAFNVAKKARGWLNQIFRFGLAKGVVDTNPATDLDILAAAGPARRNHAHLSLQDLPAFMVALESYRGSVLTVAAIHLLLLTAVRPGELRHSEWQEFDLDASLWSIPAPRMKMRRPHSVPLPKQAVAILRRVHEVTGRGKLLFPSRDDWSKPMSDNTINQAFRRLGYSGKQTGHGFRHLVSTALNERGYNRDWIERQLAHGDSNEIRSVYNKAEYLDQRRQMMQAWADELILFKTIEPSAVDCSS